MLRPLVLHLFMILPRPKGGTSTTSSSSTSFHRIIHARWGWARRMNPRGGMNLSRNCEEDRWSTTRPCWYDVCLCMKAEILFSILFWRWLMNRWWQVCRRWQVWSASSRAASAVRALRAASRAGRPAPKHCSAQPHWMHYQELSCV